MSTQHLTPLMPCHHTLLQALDKLQSEWEAAVLSVLEYRDTGTCVLKVRENSLPVHLCVGHCLVTG